MTLVATLNNVKLDWIDGVPGAEVLDKSLPPGIARELGDGAVGAWRASLNAIRASVISVPVHGIHVVKLLTD